jgi:nitrogenase iron protein NifH
MTHHIAFYGKGGVGTSTLISNVSAAMVGAGFSVMQLGCDPKGDSCNILNNGLPIPTVFDLVREQGNISADRIVHKGFKGISCIELGDPADSGTCPSEEIKRVFVLFDEIRLFETAAPDFVFYDIPAETSCSAFHAAIRQGGLKRAYAVTSGDFMALHAVNNIFRMLDRQGRANSAVSVGGVIPNNITNSFEESFIADFAKHTRTRTLGRIPRSLMVKQCELYGKTVIEAAPLSNQSYFYRRLANQIVDDCESDAAQSSPLPMRPEELREWARAWGDRIYALENGLVSDGAAI